MKQNPREKKLEYYQKPSSVLNANAVEVVVEAVDVVAVVVAVVVVEVVAVVVVAVVVVEALPFYP